jgi:hypothetical protein
VTLAVFVSLLVGKGCDTGSPDESASVTRYGAPVNERSPQDTSSERGAA